jgi:vanillin dehydrogenase
MVSGLAPPVITAESLNPAGGQIFARTQQAGTAEVEKAIEAAHRAFAAWGTSLASEREKLLLKTCEVIERRTPEIRDMLIDECGPVFNKALWEIDYVANCLRSAAGDVRHVAGETMPVTQPGQISMPVRRPLCVVAGIAPFNSPFPLGLQFGKAAKINRLRWPVYSRLNLRRKMAYLNYI